MWFPGPCSSLSGSFWIQIHFSQLAFIALNHQHFNKLNLFCHWPLIKMFKWDTCKPQTSLCNQLYIATKTPVVFHLLQKKNLSRYLAYIQIEYIWIFMSLLVSSRSFVSEMKFRFTYHDLYIHRSIIIILNSHLFTC